MLCHFWPLRWQPLFHLVRKWLCVLEKYSIGQSLHFDTKYIFWNWFIFANPTKNQSNWISLKIWRKWLMDFLTFSKKFLKAAHLHQRIFFYSGKILVYFAPKLSNQNYWISKPMPKSSCQTGEERLKTFALSFKNVNEFYSKKATFSLFVKKPGAAIMWEIPNRFSECYRHKTNLSLKEDNWASL